MFVVLPVLFGIVLLSAVLFCAFRALFSTIYSLLLVSELVQYRNICDAEKITTIITV